MRAQQPQRRTLLQAIALGATWLSGLGSSVQGLAQTSYPNKPVTIVVPFPPAGGADVLARILGTYLSNLWGQQVIVENRAGASGRIGAAHVARSEGDGYTLMMSSTASLGKDNVAQFAPIAMVSAAPYVVAVNPKLGAKTMRELISKAKAQPGKLTFGSSGEGSASHLTVELFQQAAGIEMLHVPYKGTGQAVNDLLSGTIDLMFAPGQTVNPHVKAGKLLALASTGDQRGRTSSDLPTIAEASTPGYAAVGWFGLLAPVSTPTQVILKLNFDVNAALSDPSIEKIMLDSGAEPAQTSPAQFGKFVQSEIAKWSLLEAALQSKKKS
jgi:tripartite-type tricarboxylate transporter receptor subunit TctC